jgi:hypothetical protein
MNTWLTKSHFSTRNRALSAFAVLLFVLPCSSSSLHAQIIADYSADAQSLGALTTFTDSSGNGNNATNTSNHLSAPTVGDSNSLFDGHQYVSFTGTGEGLATSSALFSGGGSVTIIIVYDNAVVPASGTVVPIAGESITGGSANWLDVQTRSTAGSTGDPYLAGNNDDVSSNTSPTANQLTFAVATYTAGTEALSYAFGSGAVSYVSKATTLNVGASDFEIGYNVNKTSQNDLEIGQILVENRALTQTQAAAEILSLQEYYVTPEPSTVALLGIGVLGLGIWTLCHRRLA